MKTALSQPSHSELEANPRELVVDLCTSFYTLGWVSGTGGGISIRRGEKVFIAPSGVQKERMRPEDIFVVDLHGKVLESPADATLKVSQCLPLFLAAFRERNAGAVIHSHSLNAVKATLVFGNEFSVTHLEMNKGIEGHGYTDRVTVPIIRNTAHECDLADTLTDAIVRYPRSHAVLVERHGVYVWGRDWKQAKTHAEVYDYLFGAALEMRQLGLDPQQDPTLTANREEERKNARSLVG